MTGVLAVPRSRHRDRLLVVATLALCLATLVLSASIAFGSTAEALLLVRSPWTPTQSTANAAGLLAATLMAWQVVMLAGLPWLERTWGRGVLVRVHRQVAAWSIALTALHVVLFAAQRWSRDPPGPGRAWLRLFVQEPWMLWASLGTLVLAVVMVTSARAVRGRLRYERWHQVHAGSYVAMAVVLPHVLVASDLTRGWALGYWWGLYGSALLAVLVGRVLVPLSRSLSADLRVASVGVAGSEAVTVVVAGRGIGRWRVEAGQFFVWRFLAGPGRTRGHPYSLSAAPDDASLRVTVAGSGDGARRARDLPPGTRVLVEGPLGAPLVARRRHPDLLLLVAGSGITPAHAWLEQQRARPPASGTVTLVHRVHSATERLLADDVDTVAAELGVRVRVLDGPRRAPRSVLPAGVTGDAATVLRDLVPALPRCDVVVCGPEAWVTVVVAVLHRAGVARRDVRREDFGWR